MSDVPREISPDLNDGKKGVVGEDSETKKQRVAGHLEDTGTTEKKKTDIASQSVASDTSNVGETGRDQTPREVISSEKKAGKRNVSRESATFRLSIVRQPNINVYFEPKGAEMSKNERHRRTMNKILSVASNSELSVFPEETESRNEILSYKKNATTDPGPVSTGESQGFEEQSPRTKDNSKKHMAPEGEELSFLGTEPDVLQDGASGPGGGSSNSVNKSENKSEGPIPSGSNADENERGRKRKRDLCFNEDAVYQARRVVTLMEELLSDCYEAKIHDGTEHLGEGNNIEREN